MTEIETAWLAGYWEGEGTFYRKVNQSPTASVNTTDKDVAEKVATLLRTKVLGPYKLQGKDHWGHKDRYVVQVGGIKAAQLGARLRPFMSKHRKDQIDRTGGVTDLAIRKYLSMHLNT